MTEAYLHLQVSAASHHLLRGAVGEEEAVLPELWHHRIFRHPGHICGLRPDSPCAVWAGTAAQRAQPVCKFTHIRTQM